MNLFKFMLILGTVFIMNYEGYHDIAPDASDFDIMMNAPVPPQIVYCDDQECVNAQLDMTGPKHVRSIYRIDYWDDPEKSGCDIIIMKIKMKAAIDYYD